VQTSKNIKILTRSSNHKDLKYPSYIMPSTLIIKIKISKEIVIVIFRENIKTDGYSVLKSLTGFYFLTIAFSSIKRRYLATLILLLRPLNIRSLHLEKMKNT